MLGKGQIPQNKTVFLGENGDFFKKVFPPVEIGRALPSEGTARLARMLHIARDGAKGTWGCVGTGEPRVSVQCAWSFSDLWFPELCEGSHQRLDSHRISEEEK